MRRAIQIVEAVSEDNRNDLPAARCERDQFMSHRFRDSDSFTCSDEHHSLCVAQSGVSHAFPIVATGIVSPIEEDIESFGAEHLCELDGIDTAAVPVIGNEEIVAPNPVEKPPPHT